MNSIVPLELLATKETASGEAENPLAVTVPLNRTFGWFQGTIVIPPFMSVTSIEVVPL